jgi:CoA:oxalate CoA-transferase
VNRHNTVRGRSVTGRGQYYDGSLVDGLFSIMENAIARYTISGEIPEPLGTAHPSITPFQALQTQDGWIVISAGSEKLWTQLCITLNRDDLINNSKFCTNGLRAINRKDLIEILNGETTKKTALEWAGIFERDGIPYSPVNNIKQISEDPHILYRKMLVEIDQPGVGKMRIAGSPIRLSETPGEVYAPAPRLGEHTEEVLSDLLKMTPHEIQALRAEGVINQPLH